MSENPSYEQLVSSKKEYSPQLRSLLLLSALKQENDSGIKKQ